VHGQYIPDDFPGQCEDEPGPAKSIGTGTQQYMFHLRPTGQNVEYKNLCGHFSAEIVIEAILGKKYSIDGLINKLDKYSCGDGGCGDSGTNRDELAELITGILQKKASRVTSYWGKETHVYENDEQGTPHLYTRNIYALKSDWNLDESGQSVTLSKMQTMLAGGSYLIVGAVLFTTTGRMVDHQQDPPNHYVGHWVVIKSIYGDIVNIINPFMNRNESYSWSSDFQGSMSHAGWLIRINPN
jgi:hypothetical protein